MSKGSHEVTESVITRLCEWRILNCYLTFLHKCILNLLTN